MDDRTSTPQEHTDSPPAAPKRTWRQRIVWQAKRLLVLYLIYATVLFALQRWILFPRHFIQAVANPGQGVDGLERVWIDTPEGRVEAWFLPGRDVTAERPGPAVIFGHGNAELIDHWPNDMAAYRHLGVSVLMPEYRGYGRSAGSPSQDAISHDFLTLYDWVVQRPDVDPKRIIFHGRSVGGGAVCVLARRHPPAAMILQSTFTSVSDLSSRYFVPRFLVSDPFDNLSVVSRLTCPILIAHGRHDSVIPFVHGERLRDAAKHCTFVPYDCDHNDCPPDWLTFMGEVERLLRDAGILSPVKASGPRTSRPSR